MGLKGKISINRTTVSGDNPDYIHIILVDENSLLGVCDIEMTLEAFTNAITGMGRIDCTFELIEDIQLVGKIREVKREMLLRADVEYDLVACLSAYEVDGWKLMSVRELKNHHNFKGKFVEVPFVRYVEGNLK